MDVAILGIGVDSAPIERANTSLDRLATAGAKAEASTQRLASTSGKAFSSIQAQIDRVVAQAERFVAEQQKTNQLLADMGKAGASAGAGVRRFQQDLGQAGATAQRTAQQMRQVAPQITDIVTQMAAGANPMQVFIQQGGQLKDVFGGVGPAARAVGGYLAALINPLTIAAAVAGGLALAIHAGGEETREFQKQIILSGNAAGTTTGQLQVMAKHVADVSGTVGKAAEVLALMVSTGRISNDRLEEYSQLAVRLDRVGIASKDTVADLASLGKDPVQAVLKLNDSMNFLEAGTFRRIKALQELGKTQEAVDLAQKAYADAQGQRAPQLEAQIGTLEKAWLGVKGAVLGVVDAILGIGRIPVGAAAYEAAVKNEQALQSLLQGRQERGLATGDIEKRLEAARRLTDETKAAADAEAIGAAAASKRKEQVDAAAEFERIIAGHLSAQEKTAKEIERIRNLGKQSLGTLKADGTEFTQADIDKAVAAAGAGQSKQAIEAQIARLQTQAELVDVRTKAAVSELQAMHAMGAINDLDLIEKTADKEVAGMQQRRALLQQQIDLKKREQDAEKEVAALEGQRSVQDAQIAERRNQAARDERVYLAAREQAIRAVTAAEYEQAQADRAIEISKQLAATNAAIEAQNSWAKAITDSNADVDFQLSLLGKTADEQFRLNEQRRIEIQLEERKKAIRAGSDDAVLIAQQNAEAERISAEALSRVDTRLYLNKWNAVNKEVGDGLYDILTGRGRDAADKLKDLFGELVLRPILSPIANSITGFMMGGSGAQGAGAAAGGFGNIGGLVSGATSLFGGGVLSGAGGAFGGAMSATLSNGIISGFGANMANIGTLASSGTMAGALGAVGAAVPYVGIALAIGSALGVFDHGGPKTESGFGLGVPTRGDPTSARSAVEAIQALYQQAGGKGTLDVGLFTAQDPKGTAKTQLAVNAALNGQQIYSREARLGGIENVSRKDGALEKAVTEETERVVLGALQASNLTDKVGDYLRQLGDINKLSGGAVDESLKKVQVLQAQMEQARQIEAAMFELTGTEAEKLAKIRQAELDAVDESNRSLVERLHALQDEKKAADSLADALEQAQRGVDDFREFMHGISTDVRGYIDHLSASSDGLVSPELQVNNTKNQFDRQLALARAGNRDALQSITQYADAVIKAQIGYTAGGSETQKVIADVKAMLQGLPGIESDAQLLARTVQEAAQQQVDATHQATDTIFNGLWGSAGLLATKFDSLDTNVDGLLNFDELKAALGPLADDATIMDMISKADTNHDGQISKLEAIRMSIYDAAAKEAGAVVGAVNKITPEMGPGGSLGPTAPAADDPITQMWRRAVYTTYDTGLGEASNFVTGWFDPVTNQGIPGVNPLVGFANGGAFTNGIVSRPTVFNMAQMGERGSEAIMPLANIGGSLGVRALVSGDQDLVGGLRDLRSELKALRAEFAAMLSLQQAWAQRDLANGERIAANTAGDPVARILDRIR